MRRRTGEFPLLSTVNMLVSRYAPARSTGSRSRVRCVRLAARNEPGVGPLCCSVILHSGSA